jgi:hypothetical protein
MCGRTGLGGPDGAGRFLDEFEVRGLDRVHEFVKPLEDAAGVTIGRAAG